MSKFIRNLSLFMASLPLLSTHAKATGSGPANVLLPIEPDAVPLRPLNLEHDNLFARHSSHSSHRSHSSHSSHYSGSRGAYSSPPPAPPPAPTPALQPQRFATPAPADPAARPIYDADALVTSPTPPPPAAARDGNSLVPSAPAPRSLASPPTTSEGFKPALSLEEKRRLQIMRVQIALTSLGIYDGRIDGVLNPDTKSALAMFQTLKGLPETGMMTTPTLNALGVPAVN